MKKFILILIAVTIFCSSCNSTIGTIQTEFQTNEAPTNAQTEIQTQEPTKDTVMKYLDNTYYKLKNDKELTIVYTGGSVTNGDGSTDRNTKSWAGLTTAWFQDHYPEADIKGVKTAIGGTGSYLASFRFESEIKPHEPDLLFIEFAINDAYNAQDYDSVVRTSETLVQKAYQLNPNIDIVYVLTFDEPRKIQNYVQLKAHMDVAKKYGLLYIKLSEPFYQMLYRTGTEFSDYFTDAVHPNDEGYQFYASVITEQLGKELSEVAQTPPQALHTVTLPDQILSKYPLMLNADMIYSDEIKLGMAYGWKHENNSYSWLGMRYNGRIFANTIGSKFTFTFEGTDFGIAYGIGTNMGILSCTVDGGTPVLIDACKTYSNPKEAIVAWNLPYGEHTVEIELIGKNDASDGSNFEIGALLVN